jgi:acyl-CoA dehydrogenase
MTYIEDIKERILSAGEITEQLIANMTRLGPKADRQADIPIELFDGIEVRKLNHASMPPEFGGLKVLQSGVARCVLMEMLGYADSALATALPGPSLTLPPILSMASPVQRRDLLGRFDRDEPVWGAFAVTEPSGGSDATQLSTTSRPDGSDFILNGEKCLIGNGARASFVIVFASTDPARGQFGIQPFVVDRDTPGFSVDDSEPMLGLRAVRVATLRFEECRVSGDCLLAGNGPNAGAFLAAQRAWEYMRPGLSALIIGAIERLLDCVHDLASAGDGAMRQRSVADLEQRVRPQLASARLLSHQAAALFDVNKESAVVSSMAKAMTASMARSAVAEALGAIAALGSEMEDGAAQDLERWARDFQAFELMEGTTEVHQIMISKGWNVRMRRLVSREAG